MNNKLQNILLTWPKVVIRDVDLLIELPGSNNARYSIIKRALKSGKLLLLKKGLYLIPKPYQKYPPNLFEIAQVLYGPSYISLESALSFHSWIPEGVYTTTSVSTKRSINFDTPLGYFTFKAIPPKLFYLGVERIEYQEHIMLVASPWKALADYIYIRKKTYNKINELTLDLRIEIDSLLTADKSILVQLTKLYPSKRVRQYLNSLLKEVNTYDSLHH